MSNKQGQDRSKWNIYGKGGKFIRTIELSWEVAMDFRERAERENNGSRVELADDA